MEKITIEEKNQTQMPKSKISEYIFAFLQGVAMGVSNIIPGVSGGTIALVMGIYDRFIKAISDVSRWITSLIQIVKGDKEKCKEKFREVEWLWLILLMIGRGLAVIIASGVIRYFIDEYPSQTYGTFFGLIMASIVVPSSKIEEFKLPEVLAVVSGFGLLFWVSGIEAFYTNPSPHLVLLVLGGFIATSAMILPGISGSFLLLIIGIHYFIFGIPAKILQGELFTYSVAVPLLAYALGWVLGILSFSRFINYLLKNHHSVTMAFLIGLMLGSLRKIYPFLHMVLKQDGMKIDEIPKLNFLSMPDNLPLTEYLSSWEFLSIMVCMVMGIAIVLTLHHLSVKIHQSKDTQIQA